MMRELIFAFLLTMLLLSVSGCGAPTDEAWMHYAGDNGPGIVDIDMHSMLWVH